MVVFAIMIGLVLYGWGNKVEAKPDRSFYDKIAHAGQDGRGANLDAPADPDSPYPARPEWYFLFLFQLLKYFEGPLFLVGTLVIPGAIGLLLFILPWLGAGPLRKPGHVFAVLVVLALLGGVGFLTIQAWVEDQSPTTLDKPPYTWLKAVDGKRYDPEKGQAHQEAMDKAEKLAQRAVQLAGDGIPAEGGRFVLRRDPLTQGKKLFVSNCATCHNYLNPDSTKPEDKWLNENPAASDLTDFGRKEWVKGILTTPDDPHYFGKTKLKDMTRWVKGQHEKAAKDPKRKEELAADFDEIATWLAGSPRKDPSLVAETDPFAKGFQKFDKYCTECHTYRDPTGEGNKGPDMTGYGDAEWLRAMVMNPTSALRYGDKNRMPAFRARRPRLGTDERASRKPEA